MKSNNLWLPVLVFVLIFTALMASTECEKDSGQDMSILEKYRKVVLQSGGETATVIFLHGLGDTPQGWSDVARQMKAKLPHTKWILPQALEQPVSCNNGYRSTSWFDLMEIPIGISTNDNGVGQAESVEFMMKLIEAEENNGIKSNRIVVAGFSQGGALSLATALQFNQKSEESVSLAGCVVLSGWALPEQKLETFAKSAIKSTSFFIGHGTADNVVLPENSDHVHTLLGDDNVILKKYSMPHSSCPEEISDLYNFLQKVVPLGA